MNEYAEMLECQLRFAEEEKEQAVAMAYRHGVEEGKQIALEIINSMDFDFGDFYDHTRQIKEMIAEALHCTEGAEA